MPSPLIPQLVAPEQAKELSLVLHEMTITGAVTMSAIDFDDLWKPLGGQRITIAQLYEIANAITARYTQAGYALAFAIVPVQEIKDGRVTLRVVEGYVDKVSFTGDPLKSLIETEGEQGALLQRMASHIMASRPLKADDLERYMMLINDFPGVTATSSFVSSPDAQEASTLTINIQRQLIKVEAMADNRMSKNSRRWNIGGTATLNGLLYGADALRLEMHCAKTGCNDSHDATIKWSTLVGGQGLVFSLLVNSNGSQPVDGFLVPLEFKGKGFRTYWAADYPLIRSRPQRLDIGAGLDLSDSKTKTFAGTLTQDKVRVFDLHGTYDFVDGLGAGNVLKIKLLQGLANWGATAYDDPLKSRLHGAANFTAATLNAVRTQPLFDRFSLYLEGEGQAALSHSLLSASQCVYGGSNIGRGYDGGAINGDHCLSGLIELRRDAEIFKVPVQGYAFSDIGKTWIKGALLDGEARSDSASSAGLGLRFGENTPFSGDLQLAFPLRKAYAEGAKNAPRLFLFLKASY